MLLLMPLDPITSLKLFNFCSVAVGGWVAHGPGRFPPPPATAPQNWAAERGGVACRPPPPPLLPHRGPGRWTLPPAAAGARVVEAFFATFSAQLFLTSGPPLPPAPGKLAFPREKL